MNCEEVLSRLHAFLDGEVSTRHRQEMEEHLRSCPSCHSRAERIRRTSAALDRLTVPPLPQAFAAGVMAEARTRAPLARKKKSFFTSRQPLRWLLDLSIPMRWAACATVLLACLLGLFMGKELFLTGSPRTSVAEEESLDGFEWFSPTPPTSLGSAYLTLASIAPEDQETK